MGKSQERVAPEPRSTDNGSWWLFPDRMEIRAHDWTPGPSIEWRTAMEEYIGLDVSMKETSVSIRRAGERIWRGKCASDPRIIAELIRKRAPAVTATAFTTAIERPDNFKKSRSVGAWVGLTTRRYQSGEVDYDGHISRRGDSHLRGLLYEAAAVILTRSSTDSTLRTWGLKLRERIGFKRAAVAVARKLAVIMHTMLKTGELFNPNAGATA